ncbi:hypothetical protein [Azorhizobium]|nr:hypothetical protein [Azorhizobium]TDU00688.1 hypothetical protein DFO45_0189 [Azorhizobium sp. AG788]
MKTTLLRTAAFSLALATGAAGLASTASADDSINAVNDSMVQQRQMDYLSRHGGYVLIQDQNSMAVGGRNGTMVLPANRTYTPTNVYVVTPGYQSVPSSTYYAPY